MVAGSSANFRGPLVILSHPQLQQIARDARSNFKIKSPRIAPMNFKTLEFSETSKGGALFVSERNQEFGLHFGGKSVLLTCAARDSNRGFRAHESTFYSQSQ